jgi:ABC-type transport system substrate-binding protein
MPPSDPSFPAVDRVVRKYEFDSARAAAQLQEAGWVRSSDGIARNAAGESLDIPMQNQPNDFDQQEALVVANNWKSVGITSDIHRLSSPETRDNELRSTYAGVSYGRRAFTLDDMIWTRAQVPRPDNRWTGQNRSGYVNPNLEDLWSRALGTIDRTEREGLLIQALQVMTADAVVSLTHQQPGVIAYNADAVGPEMPDDAVAVGPLWNISEWRWK